MVTLLLYPVTMENSDRHQVFNNLMEFKWSSAFDRLTGSKNIPLNSIKKYLDIEDWNAYLMEKKMKK